MITLLGGIVALVAGYFLYGAYIEKNFKIDPARLTPAEKMKDGSDFVPMSKAKNSIIQLLNIAGTGPIFGPIMGALYGPSAYIWIVFGCIFGGAVHDYMVGMISLRNNGAHLPDLASKYLGRPMKHLVNIFAMLLLILVATVFVTSPANLIQSVLPDGVSLTLIIALIFIYYLISTVLPIDKAMGKVYPWFGGILIISTIAIGVSLLLSSYELPNLTIDTMKNFHPKGTPIFPILFFTISCGALSGFHATQSPMVSRTITNEREGRFIFYGMMIVEGVIAMIWAAAAMSLFKGQTLSDMIDSGTPSVVVNKVSYLLLGNVIGTFAIIGVIVLPISSGLSAFRSLRTILADYLKVKQNTLKKILMISLPLYAISLLLMQIDFNILWRYFNWANQVTAVIALFVATKYLYEKKSNYFVTLLPGIFMLYACVMYLLSEPIGFNLGLTLLSYTLGGFLSLVLLIILWQTAKKERDELLK